MLDSKTIRSVLPSNLINPDPPLTPVKVEETTGEFVASGYPPAVPPMYKPVFGSYGAGGLKSKGGITFDFDVPRGTHQIDLQIAGHPNVRGITFKVEGRHGLSYDSALPIEPVLNWQTIWISLDPKAESLKITAKDQSDGAWIAFSMPSVSTGGFPGRWARSLAQHFFYLIDAGLVLLVLGAIASLANVEGACLSPQSTIRTVESGTMNLPLNPRD